MKIDSYAVASASSREYQKVEAQVTQVIQNNGQQQGPTQGVQSGSAVVTSLSEWAEQAMAEARQRQSEFMSHTGVHGSGSVGMGKGMPANKEELKARMLETFLSAITGKRISLRMEHDKGRTFTFDELRHRPLPKPRPLPINQRPGGFSISSASLSYERESVSYSARGVVKTADGRTINVDVGMQMSREFASFAQNRLNFSPQTNVVDPLVINYGGTAASLTGEKFSFDLDADGAMDQISFAGEGSGFLALDKNGDKNINDGSELFGPNTGNGFDELRAYDSDGNNWIDENDEIFSKLQIWSKDADGNDQMFSLLEADVGAIYLGDVSTQFDMGEGVMRSTSFFLKENGGAGTVSHIDLRV